MKSFVAEILTADDPQWQQHDARFATWGEAHDFGLDLGNHWQVTEMRVVLTSEEVNCRWVDGHLEAVEDPPEDTGGMDWSLVDFTRTAPPPLR